MGSPYTGSELGFQWVSSKLGRLGFLRTLATASDWGILSRINWDDGEPLERSLPVVNWDFNGFLQ